jgi:hypothetical protein
MGLKVTWSTINGIALWKAQIPMRRSGLAAKEMTESDLARLIFR